MGEVVQFRPGRNRKRGKHPGKNWRSKVPSNVIPFSAPPSEVEDMDQPRDLLWVQLEVLIEMLGEEVRNLRRKEHDER